MKNTLIDAGPIIAYFNRGDRWHQQIRSFLSTFKGQFVTTAPVVTEAMWLLRQDIAVQNEFLFDLAKGLYTVENLLPEDFDRMARLNKKYSDVPADFADLSLVVISERLDIEEILSLDSDFDIYRRLGRKSFKRIFPD
ncbi:MAG: PIN domain-containing protein [Candidatus Obscuribacterales bacterium]|nr:PIN domain-containing protein [Candidatus Obscuribacterales bacterium]